jgi:PhnB protein
MAGNVSPIPKGYEGVTTYLRVRGGAAAIDFYKKAFGATEHMRLADPSGKIGHAELRIAGAIVMLADEHPDMKIVGPGSLGGTSVGLLFYVPDVDVVFKRAIDAGAKVFKPVQDQFYGDRSGTLTDPFGHEWTIATHIEDVTPEEIDRRVKKMYGGG